MKRYGYLYQKICDVENVKAAIICASRNKRNRNDVRYVLRHIDQKAEELSNLLKTHTYTLTPYTEGIVVGGTNNKARNIHKPHFYPDQCIHWAIYLQIAPILQKSFYEYSCGSVPGRGSHYGKRAIERWVRNDRKHTKYYLKMDIHHYYPSVQPDRIKALLKRKFKDKELLAILDDILDMHTGLPIGILLSQWFANYFLTDLDFMIKQKLKAKYYVRYMDDMVIFGSNKRQLHKMRVEIGQWLNDHGLEMKGNWQVCKFDADPLDYMGFRFYRNKTTLRKSILYRISRKVRQIRKYGVNYHRACGMISYFGYLYCTNTHRFTEEHIKPYIHIKQLKRVIRRKQRNDYKTKRKHCKASRVEPDRNTGSGAPQLQHC